MQPQWFQDIVVDRRTDTAVMTLGCPYPVADAPGRNAWLSANLAARAWLFPFGGARVVVAACPDAMTAVCHEAGVSASTLQAALDAARPSVQHDAAPPSPRPACSPARGCGPGRPVGAGRGDGCDFES